ncbi:MAG: hypothetical protein ABSF93_08415 [Candidatus Sulfotelmatobacter sp.]|jgi:hypothetical protein
MRNIARMIAMSALCAGTIIGIATAQKTEAAPPAQLPASLPIFSATDLAAKVPAPKPEDVKSIDAIMHAAYDAISGPAGARDWNRFRSIFLPQARFTQVGKGPDGATFVISWGVDEFVRDAGAVFAKEPFYENSIVNRADSYGNMTQVLSSYESHRSPGDKPFERGVNSFQLLNDGKRWWVVSIFWDSERPDNPLPANLAKK